MAAVVKMAVVGRGGGVVAAREAAEEKEVGWPVAGWVAGASREAELRTEGWAVNSLCAHSEKAQPAH
jgi:hypothetical protein